MDEKKRRVFLNHRNMNAGLQSCYISIHLSQIQHESMYYITERDPVKKQQHSNNLAHLYALLDLILKSKAPREGFHQK